MRITDWYCTKLMRSAPMAVMPAGGTITMPLFGPPSPPGPTASGGPCRKAPEPQL